MRQTKSPMAFCFLLGAISHSAASLADHSLAAADNAFGFKLIKQLAEGHPATNVSMRLPYSGDHLAMYVFLPASGSSPENVLGALSGDTWQQIKHGFRFNEGHPRAAEVQGRI
jgi:serine protease inhibitor